MNDADGRRRYTDQCGHKLFIGIDSFMLTLVAKSKRQPHPPFLDSLSHLKKKKRILQLHAVNWISVVPPSYHPNLKNRGKDNDKSSFHIKGNNNGSYTTAWLIKSRLFLLPITQTSKTDERIMTSLAFTLKEMTNGSYLFDESKNNHMDLGGSKHHTTRSLKYVPRLIQASI